MQWRDPHALCEKDRPLVLRDESKPGVLRQIAKSRIVQIIQVLLSDQHLTTVLESMPHKDRFNLWIVGLASDPNQYIEAVEHTIALSRDLLHNSIDQAQKITKIVKDVSRQQARVGDLIEPKKPSRARRKRTGTNALLDASSGQIKSGLERRILEGIAIGRLPDEPIGEIENKILQSLCPSIASSEIAAFHAAEKLRFADAGSRSRNPRR